MIKFIFEIFKTNKFEKKDQIYGIICAIMANLSFNNSMMEKILDFEHIQKVLDRVTVNKRDVFRLVANLSISPRFSPT